MGDDDVRDELGERLGVSFRFFVDVHHDVGRRQLADPVEIHVLGAADLGDPTDGLPRMDAEAGPPDQLPGQAEVTDQLGDAGDEGDDAWLSGHRPRRYMLRRYSPPTS